MEDSIHRVLDDVINTLLAYPPLLVVDKPIGWVDLDDFVSIDLQALQKLDTYLNICNLKQYISKRNCNIQGVPTSAQLCL